MCRAMINFQSVTSSQGATKYVAKYVSKFDQGNRVIVFADTRTGQTLVGKEFLHNTKIASSNFNEQRAFELSRHRDHPFGRDMPLLEIFHLLLGLPEVTTNLWFIPISTYSFELRSKHKITVDDKGNVHRIGDSNEGNGSGRGSTRGGRNSAGPDATELGVPAQRAREDIGFDAFQRIT